MAYWWVFQGDSYDRSREGRYLWAPKLGRGGQRQVYWTNMQDVRPGDVIFSGFKQQLVAISTASTAAYDSPPPDPKDVVLWPSDQGWRIDVSYIEISSPLPYRDFVPEILGSLPQRHAAFNRDTGKGSQGYLFQLPDTAGELLLNRLAVDGASLIETAINSEPKFPEDQETTRQAIIQARKGQGKFREGLDEYWEERCALAGAMPRELLRASHIKPWTSSNNQERLDPFNGLLLSVGYDAAFGALLLSFNDDGSVLLAPDFDPKIAAAVGIDAGARLTKINPRHCSYLAGHRQRFTQRLQGLT